MLWEVLQLPAYMLKSQTEPMLNKLLSYGRSVDDALFVLPEYQNVGMLLEKLNGVDGHIRFTMGQVSHDELTFLDLLIMRLSNRTIVRLSYRKATWTG